MATQAKSRPHSFPSDQILQAKHPIINRDEKGRIVGNTPGNHFPKAEIKSLTALIKEYTKHNPSKAYRLIAKLYDLGIQGNIVAIQTILERHDGKVTDKIEMDVKPISLVFVPAAELLARQQVEKPVLELPGETVREGGETTTPNDILVPGNEDH